MQPALNALASCLVPRASCFVPRASCLLPRASCFVPRASCLLPPASCLLPPASCRGGSALGRASVLDAASPLCGEQRRRAAAAMARTVLRHQYNMGKIRAAAPTCGAWRCASPLRTTTAASCHACSARRCWPGTRASARARCCVHCTVRATVRALQHRDTVDTFFLNFFYFLANKLKLYYSFLYTRRVHARA